MRSIPIRTRFLPGAALVAMLIASGATLRADQAASGPQSESEASACPVVVEARSVLEGAGSASEAAARWLESSMAAQSVGQAQGVAEQYWKRLVDGAHARSAASQGVFVYTPESDGEADADPPPLWTPMSEATRPEGDRVVLLVHGLDEPGDIWDDLSIALSDAGHGVARFNYPNDQDPALSADELAASMRALRGDCGVERVDLVCHSMGGLVARDVLTRPEYYNADASAHDGFPAVPRIITIGTPNRGSAFAPLRGLGEVREHVVRFFGSDDHDAATILAFIPDGDGAAADALTPGSDYLQELNARPLPERTDFTIIAGRMTPLESADLNPMLDTVFARRVLGKERIERLRLQTDQVVGAVGDGVVTVESARLEGVEDTVILDANHRSLVRRMEMLDSAGRLFGRAPAEPPAIEVILDRLGEGGADG